MLKLFYITNNPEIAKTAQDAGVDRIFVDMEYIGKEERQPNMDTVKNHHTVHDVKAIRQVLDKAELLVRINPINDCSEKEIDDVINAGADIIMLPMWQSVDDVKQFYSFVNGRVKTILLLENAQAMTNLDHVLQLDTIDEVHIGLNDLHLSLGKKFLFELLADGTVDNITKKLKDSGVRFGFGGFGRIDTGLLPAQYIICEHYRLGSSMAILSRTFCNCTETNDLKNLDSLFSDGVSEIREYEKYLNGCSQDYFIKMHRQLCARVEKITENAI